jgi:hypothetical protein
LDKKYVQALGTGVAETLVEPFAVSRLTYDPPMSAAANASPLVTLSALPRSAESKGVVYTKPWVVDLILDLARFRPVEDLALRYAVEPAAGEGAFLVPMIRRLLSSLDLHGRPLSDAVGVLHAYELDEASAHQAIDFATYELQQHGASLRQARKVAESWVTVGDYLLASHGDRPADLVVGNPPYIRYDDVPERAFAAYRSLYPTMVGRCDIYVGFIEAGVRQLKDGGMLAFICADRWMRSAYGAELRRFIAENCGVDVVIEMHNAPAFEYEVAAYPAVVILRRAPQGKAIVASAGADAGPLSTGKNLADAVINLAAQKTDQVPGFTAGHVDRWFSGTSPWPALEPHRLELLQRLEASFGPLENEATGTKFGIGVATGADAVFITKDDSAVEPDRLLPLALATDTRSGILQWSGHYLVNPWQENSDLVDLGTYPKLRSYLESQRARLERRNIARRYPDAWYRTIDRVNKQLTKRHKLYFPDMSLVSNPTLDRGQTYPHHNLYYLTSQSWDLEVLGGLLLSRVAQLFIEAYCVRMRGGTLRFQAQYLRRVRAPEPTSLSASVTAQLRQAFWSRDIDAATAASVEAYRIGDVAGALLC